MKLTKGMKKALSLLLSAAMVVTGVNVTTNTAKAAEGDPAVTWTGEIYAKAIGTANQKAEGDSACESAVNGYFSDCKYWKSEDAGWGYAANVTFTFPSTGSARSVKVYGNAVKKATAGFKIAKTKTSGKEEEIALPAGSFVVTRALLESEEELCVSTTNAPDITITKIEVYESDLADAVETAAATTEPTAGASAEASSPASGSETTAPSGSGVNTPAPTGGAGSDESPAPTGGAGSDESPAPAEQGSMSGFKMWAYFADKSWANQGCPGANEEDAVAVTENGSYDVVITPETDEPAGIQTLFIDTNLYNGSTPKDFKLSIEKLAAGDKEYTVDNTKGSYFLFADTNTEKCMRVNVVNEWNYLVNPENLQENLEGTSPVNAFGETVAVNAGEAIKVTIKVEGMDATAAPYTYPKFEQGGGEDDPTPTATAGTQTTAPSAVPTTPATGGVTSGGATSSSAVGTQKIKPAKTTVVVAPNKSVKVSFTKTLATNVTKAAVVTASIANKKVVAKATVSSSSEKKGAVTIKAAKKATKGASTKVTLKSTNAAGKTVSAKITVKIQNKAKKVKAAKKSVTIKKKGKTAKLVLKVTAENKKKATTDTPSIKGAGKKIVTIKSAKASKGKITVTLKGKKKGSKTVAIKVGKKTVKVKVTVKK